MTGNLTLQEALARLPTLAGEREITPLTGGLTNEIFRVRTATQDVVVRISAPSSGLLSVDRDHEWRNSRAAEQVGVGAPVVDYLPGQGVLVVGFLPGRTHTPSDVAANLPRVAAAVRRLHEGPAFAGRFDIFAVQRSYRATVLERGFTAPTGYADLAGPMMAVETALGRFPEPLVSCHNDLLAANILDDGGDLRIVDYEYSGLNEASFELGNLVAESQIDAAGLAELIDAYHGRVHDHLLARAELWGLAGRYAWTLWGTIQAGVAEVDRGYTEFATERFELAAELLTSPRLGPLLDAAATRPAGWSG